MALHTREHSRTPRLGKHNMCWASSMHQKGVHLPCFKKHTKCVQGELVKLYWEYVSKNYSNLCPLTNLTRRVTLNNPEGLHYCVLGCVCPAQHIASGLHTWLCVWYVLCEGTQVRLQRKNTEQRSSRKKKRLKLFVHISQHWFTSFVSYFLSKKQLLRPISSSSLVICLLRFLIAIGSLVI